MQPTCHNSGTIQNNVTVHKPRARVVGWIRKDKPTAALKLCNVATRRIVKDQLIEVVGYTELTGALAQYISVMAVEMNRMGDGWGASSLLDDPVCPSGCRS
jgi:hypothetical protein